MKQSEVENLLYIVLHIHKCAGVSISSHVSRNLKKGEYCGLYEGFNKKRKFFENRSFIKIFLTKVVKKSQIRKLRIIMGHGAYFGIHKYIQRQVQYVTFLRDPVERTISHYAYLRQNFTTGKEKDASLINPKGGLYEFEDWLLNKEEYHNYMTKFLYNKLYYKTIVGSVDSKHLDQVISRLDEYFKVGLVERKIDFYQFFSMMELPVNFSKANVTNRKFYPKKINIDLVKKFVAQDIKLYKHYKKKNSFDNNGVLKTAGLYLKMCLDNVFKLGTLPNKT